MFQQEGGLVKLSAQGWLFSARFGLCLLVAQVRTTLGTETDAPVGLLEVYFRDTGRSATKEKKDLRDT